MPGGEIHDFPAWFGQAFALVKFIIPAREIKITLGQVRHGVGGLDEFL